MKKTRTCNECNHSAANHHPKKGCRVKGCKCKWKGPYIQAKKKKKKGSR